MKTKYTCPVVAKILCPKTIDFQIVQQDTLEIIIIIIFKIKGEKEVTREDTLA